MFELNDFKNCKTTLVTWHIRIDTCAASTILNVEAFPHQVALTQQASRRFAIAINIDN